MEANTFVFEAKEGLDLKNGIMGTISMVVMVILLVRVGLPTIIDATANASFDATITALLDIIPILMVVGLVVFAVAIYN